MIYFSPAKINIGLQILEKRPDGFHNLQSVMHPVGLCDILEINALPTNKQKILFSQSGLRFEADLEDNLVLKAWEMLAAETRLPPVEMHLHKQIPIGAGLGGGSSNASVTLMGLNTLARHPLSKNRLAQLAEMLGSDCPFFLNKEPMMMEGKGEILSRIHLDLSGYYLVLLFPGFPISSADAYRNVNPLLPEKQLKELIQEPVDRWKEQIVNDFEFSVCKSYPQLKELKEKLYTSGAQYASMSGSGSSLYGIFTRRPSLHESLKKLVIWAGAIGIPPAGEP